MPSILETSTPELDATVVEVLGDTFTYTPAGGSPRARNGFVEYDETRAQGGSAASIAQVMTIEVRRVDIPIRPDAHCRITLPKIPGREYHPINVRLDQSGDWWVFDLKEVK